MECAPVEYALGFQQTDQFLPGECRRFDVIGAAAQPANRATEIPSQRAQAAAWQVGQKTPGDLACAAYVKPKFTGGQRTQERLLELSEVDDRRRGLLLEAGRLMA
jgi:hypothetical protein